MVKIRLQRGGAKKRPHYRIVAIDERRQRDGRALQFLGTYDPRRGPEAIRVDQEAIAAWVERGAQVSATVRSLVKQAKAHAPAAPSGPSQAEAS
jgi:small subunit ribosomal protein S16